jgi:hypothetical protein
MNGFIEPLFVLSSAEPFALSELLVDWCLWLRENGRPADDLLHVHPGSDFDRADRRRFRFELQKHYSSQAIAWQDYDFAALVRRIAAWQAGGPVLVRGLDMEIAIAFLDGLAGGVAFEYCTDGESLARAVRVYDRLHGVMVKHVACCHLLPAESCQELLDFVTRWFGYYWHLDAASNNP